MARIAERADADAAGGGGEVGDGGAAAVAAAGVPDEAAVLGSESSAGQW